MKHSDSKTILFVPDDLCAPFEHPCTVLEIAIAHDRPLPHSCGGNGTCGTCLVQVVSDLKALPARESLEQEMADDRGFAERERLACQLIACSGLIVRTR